MKVLYIFGEDRNDTMALSHLIQARSERLGKACKAIPMTKPMIQQKGAGAQKKQGNAEKISAAIRARMAIQREKNVVVVAHEDCDEIEPAHKRVAILIENGLSNIGVPVIAAAPAFEMEAWWYLWPEAVAKVCPSWAPLSRAGSSVGMIHDAKSSLRRDLRPGGGARCREYSESDGPSIAKKVKEMNIIDQKRAISPSFDDFDKKITAAL